VLRVVTGTSFSVKTYSSLKTDPPHTAENVFSQVIEPIIVVTVVSSVALGYAVMASADATISSPPTNREIVLKRTAYLNDYASCEKHTQEGKEGWLWKCKVCLDHTGWWVESKANYQTVMRHIAEHEKFDDWQSRKAQEVNQKQSKLHNKETDKEMLEMFADHGLPHALVEDPRFRKAQMGFYSIMCRATFKNRVFAHAADLKEAILSSAKDARVSIAIDGGQKSTVLFLADENPARPRWTLK
jgi:hypothetical protein